jgi:nucleoside-triphosphatase THEP1
MKIAAVIYGIGEADHVDAMLTALAARLRMEGVALAGAVQHNREQACSPCSDMILEDLATGQLMEISTPFDQSSGGCRLDATALEDVAGVVANGLDRPVDLVLINRFGKQEMIGNGFRDLIENSVARDIPVLTALNNVHRAAWDTFAAGTADVLPPDADAIEHWCRNVLPAKVPADT